MVPENPRRLVAENLRLLGGRSARDVLDLGADALALLTARVHHGPRSLPRYVERPHALYDEHGEAAMRAALARSVADDTREVGAVERALTATAARGAP